MKCIDCQNAEMCLDHKEQPSLIGCTSGIPERKKQTNADRIRTMSDEELAKFINSVSCNALFGNEECGYPFCNSMNGSFCNGNIDSETLDWLQSEVEE